MLNSRWSLSKNSLTRNNSIKKPRKYSLDNSQSNSSKLITSINKQTRKNIIFNPTFSNPLIKRINSKLRNEKGQNCTSKLILSPQQNLIDLQKKYGMRIIFLSENNESQVEQIKILILKYIMNCFIKSKVKFFSMNVQQYQFFQKYLIQSIQEMVFWDLQSPKQSEICNYEFRSIKQLIQKVNELAEDNRYKQIKNIIREYLLPEDKEVIQTQMNLLIKDLNALYRSKYNKLQSNKFRILYEESAKHKIDNIFQINLKSNYLIILQSNHFQSQLFIQKNTPKQKIQTYYDYKTKHIKQSKLLSVIHPLKKYVKYHKYLKTHNLKTFNNFQNRHNKQITTQKNKQWKVSTTTIASLQQKFIQKWKLRKAKSIFE